MTNSPPPHCLCVHYQLLLQLVCPPHNCWDESCSHSVFILNRIFSLKRLERRNYGLDFRAAHAFVGMAGRRMAE